MTDEEIVKDLEEVIHYADSFVEPLKIDLIENTLNLINRLKSEIERLESASNEKFCQWNILAEKTKQHYADLYNEAKDILKAEAYKEFAKRLKNKIKTECNPYGKPTFDYDTSISIMRYIDNLVKEMTGEDNTQNTF